MLLRTLTLNPVEPRAKSASCLGKGLAEQNVLPHCGVENPGLLWRKGDWLLPGDLPSHERIREFEIRLSSHWYSIYSFLSKDQSSLRFLIYSFQWKRRTSFERSRFFDFAPGQVLKSPCEASRLQHLEGKGGKMSRERYRHRHNTRTSMEWRDHESHILKFVGQY